MFTLLQIESAHNNVKSGADFPKYIQEIKTLGVTAFETWTIDSHTNYFGKDGFQTSSNAQYDALSITDKSDANRFGQYLKIHQNGETDYYTFCTHCAETGVEKWVVDLEKMTCIYYDKDGNEMLIEKVPTV